jgi:hypothetical protein
MASKKKTTGTSVIKAPEGQADVAKSTPTDHDVEGHNFGQNAMLSRSVAQSRERDIQHHLREHNAKSEARRPFFKRGK